LNIFAPVTVVDLDEARSTGTAAVAIGDETLPGSLRAALACLYHVVIEPAEL
jgi:hypothetical protein